MTGALVFSPLLPWPVLAALAALSLVFLGLALWRGLSGWPLRALGLGVILLALSNPALRQEEREALSDIVLLVVDESASQSLSDRPDQVAAAENRLRAEIAALDNTELRVVRLGDDPDDGGTLLMGALNAALAELPPERLAGVFLLSDGQVHDMAAAPLLPEDDRPGFVPPMHMLLTGRAGDWDRRLVLNQVPGFAILGEEVTLGLKIEDQGDAPDTLAPMTRLSVQIDADPPVSFEVPVGRDLEIPLQLPHGGQNVIRFRVDDQPGELTGRNNIAMARINGVRDRLRVLLVSGEPHPGQRTWRNLLKSDSSVDLVHFTILRPPEKQDGVPVTELSLIAFPTRELFLEKVQDFDLIIFDRYKRRGILPSLYLDNVRAYVEAGGAVLIAAGPDFASANSIYRTPLADILPAAPTARVIEQGFRPTISELGQRHPVTQDLTHTGPDGGTGWGRWFRQIELNARGGQSVMHGLDDRPLLVLDRVGEGRVALLGSDHAWLWSRGFEGGGPQGELLRRLAHWMMKEPELEEEALHADAEGGTVSVLRRSLIEGARQVTVERPDGTRTDLDLDETAPGRHLGRFEADELGLYRIFDGDTETLVAVGPAAPREFESTIADAGPTAALVDGRNGASYRLDQGEPDIRAVRPGRVTAGRGWLGITPRDAYVVADISLAPPVPGWLYLIVAALLFVLGWLREGRRAAKPA